MDKKALYFEMLRIRKIEEAIAEKYHEKKMRCPVHLSVGQEAVAVGVCASLDKNDYCVSAHRSHAHYLAKGGNLNAMIAELYGKKTGCAKGKGGSMHLFDLKAKQMAAVPIVGSSIPIGVGIALQLKLKQEDSIVIIFFGDGASEEGVFSECLTFSSLNKLPVLFVCENNRYSVYTSLDQRQSETRSITQIGDAHGVRSKNGDGNDLQTVTSLTHWAKEKIKAKQKPILLEFSTYRFLEHCGPNNDDALGYRSKKEVSFWLDKCPIKNFRNELLNSLVGFEEMERQMSYKIDDEIKEAFLFAEQSKFPSPKDLFSHVYSK